MEKMKWKRMEKIWLIASLLIILAGILVRNLYLGFDISKWYYTVASDLAALFGVTYVFCIAKQERFAYLFGVLNVILYAFVMFQKSIYISAAYNILYSLPVLIYGFIYWGKVQDSQNSGVKYLTRPQKIFTFCLCVVLMVGFALLSKFVLKGENVVLDAIVSVSACVATFLMAKKYMEQWILFIIANFFGVLLFLQVNFHDVSNIELLLMWCIYFVNSIYGAVHWKNNYGKERVE
ncbi:MAG: nicotinamide mononucleotide transporter [Clostridia bacterium]|nr:nicotinamide mononucleotide transporter [Clostridia bacterium]